MPSVGAYGLPPLNEDGTPMTPTVAPPELILARLVDGLCQRYGCLPSQLLNEGVYVLQMQAILAIDDDAQPKPVEHAPAGIGPRMTNLKGEPI